MIVFLAVTAAGACLALLEWRRPTPLHAVRALLVLLAATALGGLAGRPLRRSSAGADLILETPHASAMERDSALGLLAGARVLSLDSIDTPTKLRTAVGDGRLLVIGDGLPASWWPSLRSLDVAWLPPSAALPSGFASVHAPTAIVLGDAWNVVGALGGDARTAAWVRAVGPDGQRDSVRAVAGRFALALRPRAAGRWLWQLESGGARASVGVSVTPRQPRTVLLLAGAPSFELTALKRRLAEGGDRVMVRVRSAKDRVVAEYVNLPLGAPAPRVDAALLRALDHLVIVGPVADALAGEEATVLLQEVRAGLGVVRIIRARAERGDPAVPTALVPGEMVELTEQDSNTTDQTARVRSLEKSAPVPVADGRFVGRAAVVLRDASDRALAVRRSIGDGSVVGTLVQDAARWRTLGDTLTFDAYWRTLLDASVRPTVRTPWQTDGDARLVAHRVATLSRFVPITDTAHSAIVLIGPNSRADTLGLVTGADDAARRVIAIVPHDSGWHRIEGPDSLAVAIHIGSDTADAARRAADARHATALSVTAANTASGGAATRRRTEVPLLPSSGWLLLLTASTGLLWLLQRRDG